MKIELSKESTSFLEAILWDANLKWRDIKSFNKLLLELSSPVINDEEILWDNNTNKQDSKDS